MISFKEYISEGRIVTIKGSFETEGELNDFKNKSKAKGLKVQFHATEPVNYFEIPNNQLDKVTLLLSKLGYLIHSIK